MHHRYTFIGLSDLGDIVISSDNLNDGGSFELLGRISARRRLSYLLDGSIDNEDNQGNENEEYFDFRNYPLTINWAEVNNLNNDSCINIHY